MPQFGLLEQACDAGSQSRFIGLLVWSLARVYKCAFFKNVAGISKVMLHGFRKPQEDGPLSH